MVKNIYAVEIDECTKLAADKKEKIQQVDELIECRVCDKKHKKSLTSSSRLTSGRSLTTSREDTMFRSS